MYAGFRKWNLLLLSLLLIQLLVALSPVWADTYTVTDIGLLQPNSNGNAFSIASSLNNSGHVVGYASVSNGYHAFLYSGGVLQDLGTMGIGIKGDSASIAFGINDSDQVVGYTNCFDSAGIPLGNSAFLWDNGKMQLLGNLGVDSQGHSSSVAFGINAAGQISGTAAAYSASGDFLGEFPTLFTQNSAENLGSIPGTEAQPQQGIGTAINANGQVAGFANAYNGAIPLGYHAILISQGTVTDLGTLGTDAYGNSASLAFAINASGQVVGYSQAFDAAQNNLGYHAFLYQNGKMTDLGVLATFTTVGKNGETWTSSYSQACGINTAGQIVGISAASDSQGNSLGNHGFIYANGILSDLNGLLDSPSDWTIIGASAINDAGQIAATGTNSNGETHALLLTPTSRGMTITPQDLIGGATATGKITLAAPVKTVTIFTLTSDSRLMRLPSKVSMAVGKREVTFPVTTDAVKTASEAHLTARAGNQSMIATLKMKPVTVNALSILPKRVASGKTATATFTLNAPVPTGGLTATFTSSSPKIAWPTQSKQPLSAGMTKGTVTIMAANVSKLKPVMISVTVNGITIRSTVTVTP